MNKKTFKYRVFETVRKIKKGQAVTYKEVAARAGSPLAYRAVGNILKTNYDKNIPCHRVIRSDGKLGGYNKGARKKAKLLRSEGFGSTPEVGGRLKIHEKIY